MRRFASSLLPLALLLGASAAEADELYRTNTGPGGADFSGVELGPDLGAALGSAGSANISGLAGGAHIGYNFQAAQIVGGVEADGMFSSIRQRVAGLGVLQPGFPVLGARQGRLRLRQHARLRHGRLGLVDDGLSGPRRLHQPDRQGRRLRGGPRIRDHPQRFAAGRIAALRLRRRDLCDALRAANADDDDQRAAHRRRACISDGSAALSAGLAAMA